jgi:hypothetical protein
MPRADKHEGDMPDLEGSSDRSCHAQPRKVVPSPDSVVSEAVFISPKGRVYRILRTSQTDPYDPPAGQVKESASDQAGDKPQRQKRKRRRKR